MFTFTVLASLALVPFAAAQADNLQINAIKAHFTQSRLVPELVPEFNPTAVMNVAYTGVNGPITPGQALTNAQVGPVPTITVTPANGTLDGTYTLVMADAAAVGADNSAGVTRHWLVNGVTVDGSALNTANAVVITTYGGPAPPAGTGPHRYAFLMYAQPADFAAPQDLSQPNTPISAFDLNAYVQNSNLGAIVAGNYITVEDGTASASIPVTSAVVTSTLAPAASGSATGSHSGSHSGSQSGASGSASPTGGNANTNGALSMASGSSLALGLVGLLVMIVA